MAGEEVRTLPFLEWRDPLALLEKQTSPEFSALCQKENAWHTQFIKSSKIQDFIKSDGAKSYLSAKKNNNFLTDAFRAAEGRYRFDINLYHESIYLSLPGLPEKIDVSQFDYAERANGDYIVLTTDESEGQELYTLYVYFSHANKTKLLWSLKNVGPSCLVVGDKVLYTRGEKYHIFDELATFPLKEGPVTAKSIYKIRETENILLSKVSRHAFLTVTDYAHNRLYRISESSNLEPVKPATYKYQIPGGEQFIYYESETGKYKSTNPLHVLPSEGRPLYYSDFHELVLTIRDGVQTLWRLGKGKAPEPALTTGVPGEIQLDKIALQGKPKIFAAILRRCDMAPQLITISKTAVKLHKNNIHFPKAKATVINAVSADHTSIKGLIITTSPEPPTNLLVYCYGAYGHPTRFWATWGSYGPLLATGKWCICYVMPRGGGDDSLEQIHAGRKYNRVKTIDDCEAVIKAAQILLGIRPEATALYGRSAGGIPIGIMISRYPRGELFKAAWMEAPFVDIMRTMSDLSIPLTLNETEEFGNPTDGPAEFAAMAATSPMDTLPSGGVEGINVILRTGDNDRQVYAYEPLKYAQRLRGSQTIDASLKNKYPAGIYLFCGKHEGHFYSKNTHAMARVEDMAALNIWCAQN